MDSSTSRGGRQHHPEAQLLRYPYEVQSGWNANSIKLLILGILLVAAAAFLAYRGIKEQDVKLGIAGSSFFGILACVALGSAPRKRQTASFRYLNGEVMSRALKPVADSWVHLAPSRPLRVTSIIAFVWFSLGAAAMGLIGLAQIFRIIPVINTSGTATGLFFATFLALAAAVVSGWLMWLMVQQYRRSGSFGRRPTGIALGEQAVTVRLPARDAEIPWESITAVDASQMSSRRAPSVPFIRVHTEDAKKNPLAAQHIAVESITVPPDALYTALRWYLDHPESRWELGRVEGERRLEGWRQAALA